MPGWIEIRPTPFANQDADRAPQGEQEGAVRLLQTPPAVMVVPPSAINICLVMQLTWLRDEMTALAPSAATVSAMGRPRATTR